MDLLFGYTWSQWLAYFYLYCFLGWCFESTYVSIHEKRLVNRGFLRGPVIPIYGAGGIMMLLLSAVFTGQYIAMFFMGMLCATVLEYVTGVVMEKLFKVRYWDYSDQKLNFQGYICLSSTIAWGVLTVLFTGVINRPMEYLILLPDTTALGVAVICISAVFLFDVGASVRAALDLAEALEKFAQARRDLEDLRVQMALLRADVKDASVSCLGQMRETAAARITEAKALPGRGLEYAKAAPERGFVRLSDLKAELLASFADFENECRARPEYLTLTGRLREIRLPRPTPSRFTARVQRAIFRGNPGAVSRRYGDALRELKEQVLQRSGGSDDDSAA